MMSGIMSGIKEAGRCVTFYQSPLALSDITHPSRNSLSKNAASIMQEPCAYLFVAEELRCLSSPE